MNQETEIKYTDKLGKPIELMEWGRLISDPNYKIIKQTTVADGKWISTVWLGTDHSFGDGEPLFFETMVFPKKGDFNDIDLQRYTTLEEAEKGHEEVVKKYS